MGLTLGISGALLIFLFIHDHLNVDKFHHDPDRIFRVVSMTDYDVEDYTQGLPQPFGDAFRRDYDFAENIAMRVDNYANLVTVEKDGMEKRIDGKSSAFVEPDYFKIFNFPLAYGNKREILTQPHTALVTENLAKKLFGKSNAIGQQIKLNHKRIYTITGILKDIPEKTDNGREIYLSYPDYKEQNPWMASDSSWVAIASSVQCFVKLKPHVLPDQVEAVFPNMLAKYIKKNADKYHLFLQPLHDIHFNTAYDGKIDRKQLYGLGLIGAFLLLMACINFVNLATAQAFTRAKEVGVRKTLGSQPKHIFSQFILETGFVVSFAFLLSVLLIFILLPHFNQVADSSISLERKEPLYMFLISVALIVGLTLAAGYYPGIKLASFKTRDTLKGVPVSSEHRGLSLRKILVLFQFSIVQLLIICTLVIGKQMRLALKTDLGFNKDGLIFLPVPQRDATAIHTLRNQLSSLPEIADLSFSFAPPLTDVNNYDNFVFDNQSEEASFEINIKKGDDHYLSVYDLTLIAGENFTASDTASSVLVNETFLKNLHLKTPEEALGKTISIDGDIPLPIVGIVKDFHNVSIHQTIDPLCIVNDAQRYYNVGLKISAKTLTSALPKVEKIWKAAFPKDLYSYHFYDKELEDLYKSEINLLWLVNLFAGLTIVIGCLGLLGLVSFMVNQKTKEVGIRKVLGATIAHVLWLFGKQFALLLSLAAVMASPIALLIMTSWLNDFAYRTTIGAGTLILSVLITVVIAGITVSYKTIKAALANPVESLRTE